MVTLEESDLVLPDKAVKLVKDAPTAPLAAVVLSAASPTQALSLILQDLRSGKGVIINECFLCAVDSS